MMEMMMPRIDDLISEVSGAEKYSEEEIHDMLNEMMLEKDAMYVLTNKSKLHGAALMFNNDCMDKIAERFGEFYVLPSSIHELLIVSVSENGPGLDTLRGMVCEVNATQVAPEDRLTNSVYFYDANEHRVKICIANFVA